MNPALPDAAAELGATAEKAVRAAGGTDLARRAEGDPGVRTAEVAGLLDALGAGELDPRNGVEEAVAAGELCRVGGRYCLPYPLPGYLLRDGRGSPVAVVGDDPVMVDHGDLFAEWKLAGTDGRARTGRPAGGPLGSKLGPFVTRMADAAGECEIDPLEVSLVMTLHCWRVLGAVERSIDLAVEHVRGREQFGKPLAAFQAVQFQLADAAVARDGLGELCRFTTWRLFEDPSAVLVDSLALRLHACDTAREVLPAAQHLFGASGLCDEFDISVLARHLQPDLRLPFGAERTAGELFDAVSRDGFASLFPHGRRSP